MDYYTQIPGENMFDFEDYYTSVADWLPSPCRVAEVGNADGRSAIFLAEKLHSLGKEFKLIMIDNMDYGGDEQMITLFNHIFKSGLQDSIDLINKDSLAASCIFPDGYFDSVFLDSSHKYEETKAEIRLWSLKIKEGGILAGHDYFSTENPGVYKAVQELISIDKLQTFETRNSLGVWQTKITKW